MHIYFINHHGGGFADTMEVQEGTTIKALFADRMKDCDPADYLIRVNRQPSAGDQILQPGDRVSITPTKIHGARLAA